MDREKEYNKNNNNNNIINNNTNDIIFNMDFIFLHSDETYKYIQTN